MGSIPITRSILATSFVQIFINGEPAEARDGATVAELLIDMQMAGQRLAVERNREIVPRSRWGGVRLVPGDRLEIVRAVGGG